MGDEAGNSEQLSEDSTADDVALANLKGAVPGRYTTEQTKGSREKILSLDRGGGQFR